MEPQTALKGLSSVVPKQRDELPMANPSATTPRKLQLKPLPPLAKPEPPKPYKKLPLSDLGNAQRLIHRHGKNLRYCPLWKKWLVWDGKRWKVDDTGEVERLAKETVRAFQAQAKNIWDESREETIEYALKCESAYRLTAMIRVAQTEPGVPVLPKELDSDPFLLNCSNGTLNLKTGTLQGHRQEDLITKITPVEYNPNATCPQFEAFLAKVTGNDVELAEYLRRAIGYSLTGDVGEKALFFLHGDGNNGKTTFLEIIRVLLGDYAGQVPIESLMTKQGGDGISNDIARLKGLRFVTSSEAEQGGKLAESKVKQITGMGTLQARFLYGEYFEFTPTFKIFMDANHKPEIRGDDAAIWNRMKLVPFSVQIPTEEIDKQLPAKLRTELSGILNWALKGCLDWQQRQGLGEPQAISDAVKTYRSEMDIMAHFIDDVCDVGNFTARSADLYAAFKKWCLDHNEQCVSQRQFSQMLKKRGFKNKKVDSQRGWSGIGLKGTTPLLVGHGEDGADG